MTKNKYLPILWFFLGFGIFIFTRIMKQLPMHKNIEPFGKDISIMEMDEIGTEKKLPFYADGFAGIVYSKSTSPFYQQPKGKKLPNFYLYGQTVEPITLDVNGAFKLICIRLYPFAVRILLGVEPKVLRNQAKITSIIITVMI